MSPVDIMIKHADEWGLDLSIEDVHLVLEYNEGDEILGYRAPRSNRFYFDIDPNGGHLATIEAYHNILKTLDDKPRRHLFGGYQIV